MVERLDRRGFLSAALVLAGSAALSGCAKVAESGAGQRALQAGEDATLYVQRLLLTPQSAGARIFRTGHIALVSSRTGPRARRMRSTRPWPARALPISVWKSAASSSSPSRPRSPNCGPLPARTQITRHDCVEGWSCIGKWTGVPLSALLQRAELKPEARYVVFHGFDEMDAGGLDPENSRYYESLDLVDAYHPQTILAYDMNGAPTPVAHGAPLRLRVERQLGYKMAKYVKAIEVVDRLPKFTRRPRRLLGGPRIRVVCGRLNDEIVGSLGWMQGPVVRRQQIASRDVEIVLVDQPAVARGSPRRGSTDTSAEGRTRAGSSACDARHADC